MASSWIGFRQKTTDRELKYMTSRLKTSGGVTKLKRLFTSALASEYGLAS